MSEDSTTKAKRLGAKMRLGRLTKAVVAWKELHEFEQTILRVEQVAKPIADSVDKKPSDRTPRDVSRLVPLIAKIKTYHALAPAVHEFLATYCTLDVVWDSVEMPRTVADCNSFFSIISGEIRAVVAEAGDPQLTAMARMAARQLMNTTHAQKEMDEDEVGPLEDSVPMDLGLPEASNTSEPDTLSRFGLAGHYNVKQVTTQLWRTMLDIMHQGLMPSRTQALEILSGAAPKKPPPPVRMSTAGSPGSMLGQPPLRASMNGGVMAARMSSSGAAPSPVPRLSQAGGGAAPVSRVSGGGGPTVTPRTAAVYNGVGPALVELHVWDSFCGRDMDTGFMEVQESEVPPKVQGAACRRNTMTALLVVSRGVYRRAMQMQQEIAVRNAVDCCCRLPFLRHTPLKELYRLSKHLAQVHFAKGDVMISQGKEHSSVFFLLEGEVELVVDVPLTYDRELLLSSLMHIVGKDTPAIAKSMSMRRQSGKRDVDCIAEGDEEGALTMSRSTVVEGPSGPLQRVVLARRGPGVILGDDSIREKHMIITVIAATPILALSTSAQRFTASLDGLTQCLFNKLRVQHSATKELTQAIANVSLRKLLFERCRGEVIAQTYEGMGGMPSTLQRDPNWGKAKIPWVPPPPGGLFSSPISLEAGEQQLLAMEATCKRGWSKPGRGLGGQRADALAGADGLSSGLRVVMFKDAAVSDSLNNFLQSVKATEEQRLGELRAKKNEQQMQGLEGYVAPRGKASIASTLDLSDVLMSSASVHQQYTDMLEAACLAIIQVGPLQGQSAVASEVLSPVLDDAIVSWSQLTHSHGLQLVRWTSHEYYLIGGLNPGGQKRPMVRIMADALLEMKDVFYHNMQQSDVPYFYFAASMVIGTVFSSYDCGRFLSGVTGHAFDAATQLCARVLETNHCGAILVSDAVMQAIGRTHCLEFNGSGYILLSRAQLPCGTTFEEILGKGSLEKEPLSAGNPRAGLFRIQAERNATSHFGDAGASFSLDDGFATVHAANTQRLSNLVPKLSLPPLEAGSTGPLSPGAGHGAGIWPLSPSSRPRSPGARGSVSRAELGGSPRSPQRSPSLSSFLDGGTQPSCGGRVGPVVTLEPKLQLTRVTKQREQLQHTSKMDFRKKLRQEIQDLRASLPEPVPPRPRAPARHVPSPDPRMALRAPTATPSTACSDEALGDAGIHGITPYGPGAGPLASVSARRRCAQVLFGSSEEGIQASSREAASQAQNGGSASPSHRPRSPGSSGSPLPLPHDFLRTPSLRPELPEQERPPEDPVDGTFLTAARQGSSPTPGSRSRSRPGSQQRSRSRGGNSQGGDTVATNFGPVALPPLDAGLQALMGSLPEAAASALGAGSPQERMGSSRGGGPSAEAAGRAEMRGAGPSINSSMKAGRMFQVDSLSGLTGQEIHHQAVTTWKDLGSLKAAEEYVQHLNPALINISFSTAGLVSLPELSRLPYLDSLAASFNSFGNLNSRWLLSLSPHLKVLSISHSHITELPANLGEVLPCLLELNVSSNSLSSLPESLFTHCLHLTALSFEHNQITFLPPSFSKLQRLHMLYASNNELDEIWDNAFESMQGLQVLDVSFNLLKDLPPSVTALVSLHTLLANCNLLESLPAGLLASATALTRLELAENSLYKCGQITGFSPAELEAYNSEYNSIAEDDLDDAMDATGLRTTMSSSRSMTAGTFSRSGTLDSSAAVSRAQSMRRSMKASSARTSIASASAGLLGAELQPQPQPQAAVTEKQQVKADGEAGKTQPETPGGMKGSSAASRRASKENVSTSFQDGLMSPCESFAAGARPGLRFSREEADAIAEAASRTPCEAAAAAAARAGALLLPRLQVLDLSSNRLLAIPPWLSPSITCVNLSRNQLVSLHAWTALRLTSLKLLGLQGNKIVSVSRELSRVTTLQMAALQENPCTEVETTEASAHGHGHKGSGAASVSWLEQHITKMKYQIKVDGMNAAAAAAATAASTTQSNP